MKLIIDELTDNIRIDTYLADYMQDFSRSKIQSEIKKGSVLVNSKTVKPSYSVKEGDVLEIAFGTHTVKAQVLSVTEHARKEEAALMYKILD